VKPFAERYGTLRLRDVDVQLALEWLGEKRWTHGGLRAMFTDARNAGLIDANPFTGLRLPGSHGRRDLEVVSEDRCIVYASARWKCGRQKSASLSEP
jgi:hypothetical protein